MEPSQVRWWKQGRYEGDDLVSSKRMTVGDGMEVFQCSTQNRIQQEWNPTVSAMNNIMASEPHYHTM